MGTTKLESLTAAIAAAAGNAFRELFDTAAAGEHFYYCTLVTTEEGFAPVVSAWSREALAREAQENTDDPTFAEEVKWSYADSPYCEFGYETYFDEVERLFDERPSADKLSDKKWDDELELRLAAMTEAMARLDREGLFARNQPRREVVVCAELMPPDASNAERIRKLNPPSEAVEDYLREAAESE